jgi:Glycosyl transferase family 2
VESSVLQIARRGLARAFRRAGGATSADVESLHAEVDERLGALGAGLEWVGKRIDALEEREYRQSRTVQELKNLAMIEAVTRWVRHASLSSHPLISVVMPTKDRTAFLERAIASVRAQRYENWELLVVDDGGSEDSKAIVEATGDPRVSWSRIRASGVAGARNAGLKQAAGELIAYLDDDNTLDPDWLFAVAWAFEQQPEVDVLYGAFVIDDMLRVTGEDAGAMPWTFLHEWDRELLSRENPADISAMAHRSGLPGAWFDEGLREMADWDLLVRLTADKDPLVLPAVACYYRTDAPRRLTKGPTHDADHAIVAARAEGAAAASSQRAAPTSGP